MLDKVQLDILKCELMCKGITIPQNIRALLSKENSGVSNQYVHGAFFQLENGAIVNVPLQESFAELSDYALTYEGGVFYVIKDERKNVIKLISAPPWMTQETSAGIKIGDILTIHGDNTICMSYHKRCDYVIANTTCRFCSFNPPATKQYAQKNIEEAIDVAVGQGKDYSFALSNGTILCQEDYMQGFIDIIDIIKKRRPESKISIELSPVSEGYFDMLLDKGVSALSINIELYDDNIRRMICPGKSQNTVEVYFKTLEQATKRFGAYMVSSVLIFGIEQAKITIETACKLIDSGVLPIVIPFKPYDHCYLKNFRLTNPIEYYEACCEISKYFFAKRHVLGQQYGCNACGGCSVISNMLGV